MSYRGVVAEMVKFRGHNGDTGDAYYARPSGNGPFPGVVLIHHLPGWDEWIIEVALRLALNGYACIAPHLYFRDGPGSPDDIGARVRAAGGVPDAQVVGDAAGAREFLLAQAKGKTAVMGFCSGGRHALLVGCSTPGFDAVVNCWGGNVIMGKDALDAKRPVPVIDLVDKLPCPIIGLFGNDDKNPSPEHANKLEEKLKSLGKTYEFYRYDGAAHAFFNYKRESYRPVQAEDGWGNIFAFFKKYL